MADFDVAGQNDIQVKMILTLHDSPLFPNPKYSWSMNSKG